MSRDDHRHDRYYHPYRKSPSPPPAYYPPPKSDTFREDYRDRDPYRKDYPYRDYHAPHHYPAHPDAREYIRPREHYEAPPPLSPYNERNIYGYGPEYYYEYGLEESYHDPYYASRNWDSHASYPPPENPPPSQNAPPSKYNAPPTSSTTTSTSTPKKKKPAGLTKQELTKIQQTQAMQAHIAPKNDYSQHFVDTRQRPQNFIRDADLADRFDEYPKLKELVQLKDQIIKDKATPPMYIKADLKSFDLSKLGCKFDVILIDPPWEEYEEFWMHPYITRYSRRVPGASIPFWSFEEIMNLKIETIAESPSFIFIWCGSEEGLDQGRLLLKKWGYRRCEDIVWVKTNKSNQQMSTALKSDTKSIFHHTKEHCLMGIKGTVRRNQDGHLIHANVDTDVIIWEEPPHGSPVKPEELYHIIEHFSLGRRRLELFGCDHNIRIGWVTVGTEISSTNYSAEKYKSHFEGANGHLLPSSSEIEELRPKSPPRGQKGGEHKF